MTQPDKPREVRARRMAALGSLAVAAFAAPAMADGVARPVDTDGGFLTAQSEGEGATIGSGGEAEADKDETGVAAAGGEGEGGGSAIAPDIALMRDLGFMTGHLRAGMQLYEAGDFEAAKTHMGHPIEEKYEAVAGRLEALGHGDMRADLTALVSASDSEAPVAEVRDLLAVVIAGVEEVRVASDAGPRQQILGLAELMRVAGAEYAVAVEGGTISNLHEYQDSWGFLQTIRVEAAQFADAEDPDVAEAGAEIVAIVDDALVSAFGDMQGEGIPEMDPSVLYGGAARIELAGLALE